LLKKKSIFPAVREYQKVFVQYGESDWKGRNGKKCREKGGSSSREMHLVSKDIRDKDRVRSWEGKDRSIIRGRKRRIPKKDTHRDYGEGAPTTIEKDIRPSERKGKRSRTLGEGNRRALLGRRAGSLREKERESWVAYAKKKKGMTSIERNGGKKKKRRKEELS